jgi:hypothetical protein
LPRDDIAGAIECQSFVGNGGTGDVARDHPCCDVTAGVYAAPRRACPSPKTPSHPLPWRARTQHQGSVPRSFHPQGAKAGDLPVPGLPSVPVNPYPPQPTAPRRSLPRRRCA